MKTDNELIAEFMGYEMKQGKDIAKYISGGHEWYWVGENFTTTIHEYNPDERWDWLMPVVEKINKLEENGEFKGFDLDIIRSMHEWISLVQINNAHTDIVTIIKWYSSNSVTPKQ